jgi:phosphoribosylglycinamide formyltransferase-1
LLPVLGVLISGRGSNLQAIIDAVEDGRVPARIGVVVSNRPDAQGLERARRHGIPAEVVDHRAFRRDRAGFEAALARALAGRRVEYVALAGFLRVLSPAFVARWPLRLVNVHPALLPSFPGLDAQRQAIAHGVKVAGATVHFVTETVDAGPIIAQAAVPVHDDDDEETLAARILAEEHRLYPLALRWLVEGRLVVEGRRVRLLPEPAA